MKQDNSRLKIAIIGGGPAAMFVYKNLIESGLDNPEIHIFESQKQLGVGMPYGLSGANSEHVTNVSANEIPDLVQPMSEWIHTVAKETLTQYDIDPERFNEYRVLPRLLFGEYLFEQFEALLKIGDQKGIKTKLHLDTTIIDIIDKPSIPEVLIETSIKKTIRFDRAIICMGHTWPLKNEGKINGYYDSPYPPAKLARSFNHPVALKGASLTAIDAIRTIARNNGRFVIEDNKVTKFVVDEHAPDFKLMLHSIDGLLPAIRFHLEDSHLSSDSLLTDEEITAHRNENDGFLSLDFIFEKDFKEPLAERDSALYDRIKDMSMEEFVDLVMNIRESIDPFELFKAEYVEAARSIRKQESVHWKELLSILSFAMNYPAKYFSAEDMGRLTKTLKPLISIVIAFVPQSSSEELIALHDAGKLSIIAVDRESTVEPADEGGATYTYKDVNGVERKDHYQTFIDCVGQQPVPFKKFPFRSMLKDGVISEATVRFRSSEAAEKMLEDGNKNVKKSGDEYSLVLPGVKINDNFQVIGKNGEVNERIYLMSVPYIGGYNPDYSGLDFCEEASGRIAENLFKEFKAAF
ncbi:MAG: hypothetical protein EOO02_16440 [Chitinophagaceae bacterium]|nr:MAG: hypothetical protein EOO02_16440 [Chitinophagaceae bacterium]